MIEECPNCLRPLFENASEFQLNSGVLCNGRCKPGARVKAPESHVQPRQDLSWADFPPAPQRVNKYGNRAGAECAHGHRHDSQREANRCTELGYLARDGIITELCQQPSYALVVNGVKVCTYRADWSYVIDGERRVEDAKGVKTPVYRLKKKLLKACLGIDVVEV